MTDPTAQGGVWVSHYYDGSDVWVFATEVDALRHAVSNGASVVFVRYGENPRDAVRRIPVADGAER